MPVKSRLGFQRRNKVPVHLNTNNILPKNRNTIRQYRPMVDNDARQRIQLRRSAALPIDLLQFKVVNDLATQIRHSVKSSITSACQQVIRNMQRKFYSINDPVMLVPFTPPIHVTQLSTHDRFSSLD